MPILSGKPQVWFSQPFWVSDSSLEETVYGALVHWPCIENSRILLLLSLCYLKIVTINVLLAKFKTRFCWNLSCASLFNLCTQSLEFQSNNCLYVRSLIQNSVTPRTQQTESGQSQIWYPKEEQIYQNSSIEFRQSYSIFSNKMCYILLKNLSIISIPSYILIIPSIVQFHVLTASSFAQQDWITCVHYLNPNLEKCMSELADRYR